MRSSQKLPQLKNGAKRPELVFVQEYMCVQTNSEIVEA